MSSRRFSWKKAIIITTLVGSAVYLLGNSLQKSGDVAPKYSTQKIAVPTGLVHQQKIEQVESDLPKLNIIENYSPSFIAFRTNKIDIIVLHTTEGTGTSALNTFQNPVNGVSVHYLIMDDGLVYRLVDERDTAWHCKGYNSRSIGIEFAGYHNRKLGRKQVQTSQILIRGLLKRYNLGIK